MSEGCKFSIRQGLDVEPGDIVIFVGPELDPIEAHGEYIFMDFVHDALDVAVVHKPVAGKTQGAVGLAARLDIDIELSGLFIDRFGIDAA
ncbi:hypothetical protein [uncultured Sphingorhabdus sp.]|uniref:hypothetical protein n=1 Tax=uncultured Sphingorhabdus sp. TaxID=1686106 RepID=UPI00261F2234|nr:hypothetical protein [uncultured Sphingorhabdus sp.]HMS19951.1 hypothetical protein [Sphingorhabdus sp.]